MGEGSGRGPLEGWISENAVLEGSAPSRAGSEMRFCLKMGWMSPWVGASVAVLQVRRLVTGAVRRKAGTVHGAGTAAARRPPAPAS